MNSIPKKIKMSLHAKKRLEERKKLNNLYRKKHLIDSPCIWYKKEDFIKDSAYYKHCSYICRKAPNLSCITDGKIEIIFNKDTKVVITILRVKEKFLPITQYLIENKIEKYNIVTRSESPKKPLTINELFKNI